MSKIWTPDRQIIAPSRRVWTPPSRQRGFICLPGGMGVARPANNPGAALPEVLGISSNSTNTTSASISCTAPAGTAAGDLLIAILFVTNPPTITSVTSGWTAALNYLASGVYRAAVYYRIAAGGDSVTFGLNSSYRATVLMYRVANADTVSAVGGGLTSSTSSPSTPTINPGVSDDYLWLSLVASGGAGTWSVTSAPSGYSNPVRSNTSTAHSTTACIAGSEKVSAGTSETPGAYSLSAARQYVPITIAARSA